MELDGLPSGNEHDKTSVNGARNEPASAEAASGEARESISAAAVRGAPRLSMKEVHRIVKDFYSPRPIIYWLDFLGSFLVALTSYMLVMQLPLFSVGQIVAYAISVILFYRSALFIHEIVHFPKGTMRRFSIVWNVLCGIPFLIPTATYYTHLEHHVRRHFATHDDGEYLPLASKNRWHLMLYLIQPFFMAFLAIGRFMFLTPFTWISALINRFAITRASSMVIDLNYRRPMPGEKERWILRIQETACFLLCWGVGLWLLFVNKEPLTWWNLIHLYLTSVGVLTLNHIRTLGAHRYTNVDRREVTFEDQLLDSVNYPNSWLLELAMPVGLRYHALHHLCPALPYHNLGKAHRKLMQELPADSIYRLTNSPSLRESVRVLLSQRIPESNSN